MNEHIQNGGKVYVHCKAGRGRSTVIVAAYFIKHKNYTVEDAMKYIRSKRPHVSLHIRQKLVLEKLYEIHIAEFHSEQKSTSA